MTSRGIRQHFLAYGDAAVAYGMAIDELERRERLTEASMLGNVKPRCAPPPMGETPAQNAKVAQEAALMRRMVALEKRMDVLFSSISHEHTMTATARLDDRLIKLENERAPVPGQVATKGTAQEYQHVKCENRSCFCQKE